MPDGLHLTRAERGQVRRATNRLTARERREFPSDSIPGKVYVAMIMQDGRVTCDCRGWIVRKRQFARSCKHTRELIAGRPAEARGEYVYLICT